MTKRKDLTTNEKTHIYHLLLVGSKNAKPARGKINEVAATYQIDKRAISRVWSEAKLLKSTGSSVIFKNKKVSAVRPLIHTPDLDAIRAVEPHLRQHIRDLAKLIPPSKSTIGRWMLKGLLNYHTNSMKPKLTEANKLIRLRFALNLIASTGFNLAMKFIPMQNMVHLDEKWFNQKKASMRCITVPGEAEQLRPGIKQHIPKASFACVVARPLYAEDKTLLFDGKIGVWSFTKTVQARRRSANREAGTDVTEVTESITKDVSRDFMVNKVIPAIKAKWPHEVLGKTVFIQQDNAPVHIKDDDPEFRAVADADGWNIHIIQQPANSPDFNIDLGWFRALQSLQHKTLMRNLDDLIAVVEASFDALCAETLANVWLSLQACLVECMKVKGGNNYRLPYMKKQSLRRQGLLPDNLEVSTDLIRECMAFLMEDENESEFEELIESVGVGFMLG